MPIEYVCDICSKVFNHKSHYDTHLQRLTICKAKMNTNIQKIENTEQIIVQQTANNHCLHCDKILANQSSRIRHQKTCKVILQQKNDNMKTEKIKKIKKLEKVEEIKADEELDKQYSCPNCLKIFSNKQNRDIHEQKINCTNQNIIYKKCKISHGMKRQVWAKHIGEDIGKIKCLCCKLTEITQLTFVCGHIISEFKGGDISIDNLLPICYSCNASMGTQNLNEYMIDHSL
jgi:hypothetical protein